MRRCGRFSKALTQLYSSVGVSPGYQLVAELNATHLVYKDISTLSLQLFFLLRKSIPRRRTVPRRLVGGPKRQGA